MNAATKTAKILEIAPMSPGARDREELIMEHLPQVRLIARRIHERLPENINVEDLVSAGIVGLIAAIDRFDPKLNVKLKTYAEYKIRGAILDSLRTVDWAPRQQRRRARLIESASLELEKKLQRSAKEEEIAAEIGITVEELRDWKTDVHGLSIGSLDGAGSDEDGRELMQFVPANEDLLPSNILEQAELKKLVVRAMARMPQAERSVLSMYYQQEMTLREISREMNLHESRISQLKTQGILRLRSFLQQRWPERGSMPTANVA